MNKVIGIIPARMAASRFPGKPLHKILKKPMIEHVMMRSRFFKNWHDLFVTTCDHEIKKFAESKNFKVIMTSKNHKRALDRVAEAVTKIKYKIALNDIIVCVQGDEPMLTPEMIKCVIEPIKKNKQIPATVLALKINSREMWENKDIVKIIHNQKGQILYTSRVPVPFLKNGFDPSKNIKRVGGIFAFRWKYLREFVNFPETYLEKEEACDSNRILDMNFSQYIAPHNPKYSYSVDSPNDVKYVEKFLKKDSLYGSY